jgi:hypothetical protein
MQSQAIRLAAICEAVVSGMGGRGRLFVVFGLICGATDCPLPGQERNRTEKDIAIQSTRELAIPIQLPARRQAGEGKVEDILEMRIPKFRVRNAPLTSVVQMLNALGVQVCWEALVEERPLQGYVDQQGAIAFHAHRHIALDLTDAKVDELLDAVVKAEPRYTWTRLPGTNVLNLGPCDSRLDFEVGPINEVGNPLKLIRKLGRNPAWKRLAPFIVRGAAYPDVTVNVDRCSARELLNHMARQHTGLSWHCSPVGTTFVYVPDPLVKQVMLLYPELTPGKPTDLKSRYDFKWDYVADGVATVIVEKTSIGKP